MSARRGEAKRPSVERQLFADLPPSFHDGARISIACSHASAKLGAAVLRRTVAGSPPLRASLRYSKAIWRASARDVYG